MTLYRKLDIQKKCKLTTDLVMYAASEKKGSGCCINCDNGKSCDNGKIARGKEQEDVQLLVPTAPPPYKNKCQTFTN